MFDAVLLYSQYQIVAVIRLALQLPIRNVQD